MASLEDTIEEISLRLTSSSNIECERCFISKDEFEIISKHLIHRAKQVDSLGNFLMRAIDLIGDEPEQIHEFIKLSLDVQQAAIEFMQE